MALQWVIGAAIGAAIGGLLGLLVKTSDKAWAFISTPGRGAVFGAIIGLVFARYFFVPYGWRDPEDSNVVALTAETFDAAIAGGKPVLVDFHSDACPPCHRLAPRIERLADAYADRVLIAKVDGREERALMGRFGIKMYPTLIYFAGGKQVEATESVPSYSALEKRVEKLLEQHAAADESAIDEVPNERPPPAGPDADNPSPPE